MLRQIIKLTSELIALRTTNDNPQAINSCLGVIEAELCDFNVKKFEDKGVKSVIFYNTKIFPKKFKLLLNTHIDVVPGKTSQFKTTEKEGKLFGRGTYDMKCTASVFIILFKNLSKKIKHPLGLQIVTDEERGGFNGTNFQIRKGVRADFVLSGEPTDFNIGIQSKGILAIDVIASGKSAHASQPWKGSNAVVELIKAIQKILNLFSAPSNDEWATTCNLSWIKTTNKQSNLVPDNATARLDIRFILKDKEAILKKIKNVLPKNVIMTVKHFEPEHNIDASNTFVKKLSSATTLVLGKKPKLMNHHFASDLRHFQKVGCNGATFGPQGAGMHTDNEHVVLKGLQQYYDVLEKFISDL